MESTEVRVEPENINPGDKVRVDYNGLLAKSGASQVYLHKGLSNGESWDKVNDIEMRYEDGRCTTETEVGDANELNFCFKDSANNWDNNSGYNWSFAIRD